MKELTNWAIVDNSGFFKLPIGIEKHGSGLFLYGNIVVRHGAVDLIDTVNERIQGVDGRVISVASGEKYRLSSSLVEYRTFVEDHGFDMRSVLKLSKREKILSSELAELVDWQGVDFSLDDINVNHIADPLLEALFSEANSVIARIYDKLGIRR